MLCNLLGWLIILTACHGLLFSGVNVLLINVCLLLLILTLSAGRKSHRLPKIPSAVGTHLCSELRMLEMGFPMASKSCSRAPGSSHFPQPFPWSSTQCWSLAGVSPPLGLAGGDLVSCGQAPVAPEKILGSCSVLHTRAHPCDVEARRLLCFRLAFPSLVTA